MSEVLSQAEIDALLVAVTSGSVDTEGGDEKGNDYIAYDLTSQEKIYHGRLAGLEGIHERFSRLLRITLSNFFKKNVTVTATNTDYIKFGDYLKSIIRPVSLNMLSIPKLHGHMVMLMTSKLTYNFLDAYYGGSERPFAKLGTHDEFTSIENNILKKIVQLAVKDLEESWRLNYPLEVQFDRMDSNPSFVGSIHASDIVAVVSFDVEFERLSGSFSLVIQLRALDPIQQFLTVTVTNEANHNARQWEEHWLNEIGFIELSAVAELGTMRGNIGDVQNWKAGDILTLNQDVAGTLPVYLEKILKMRGTMGTYRGSLALKVAGFARPTEKGKING